MEREEEKPEEKQEGRCRGEECTVNRSRRNARWYILYSECTSKHIRTCTQSSDTQKDRLDIAQTSTIAQRNK